MALILWAIDVPHIPKQRDAKILKFDYMNK
ncbi:uncharacterized protein FFC1_15917 [Fusarium fujikuroi]|nr:uncharacterized protein FFC1_15917 [Fusarium fujikuroi]